MKNYLLKSPSQDIGVISCDNEDNKQLAILVKKALEDHYGEHIEVLGKIITHEDINAPKAFILAKVGGFSMKFNIEPHYTTTTVNNIVIGKCFSILQDGHVSSFVRVDEKVHEGRNARCLTSSNPTYYRGEYYFIQLDLEVIPTERG